MLVVELTSEIILLSLVARSITGRYHLSKVECENDAYCLNHEKAEELHITRFCRSNGVRSVCQCRHDYFADGEICKPLTSVSDLPCDKANASKTCTDVRFETECGEDATGEVSRATSLTCSMAKKDCPWIDIATGEQTGLDSTTCVEPAQRHFCACKDGYASFNGACVFVGPSTASATRSGSTSWLLALRAALWLNCNL
ncbi:hypothetical protein BaRGS_00003902 [Batillaria attramentaria]|uniref:EGF-like domain-containing protein n=1 Tax=Batillaria attramentaria TaxID=370345 RepID=A0ABD0LYT8_9CAEN